MPTWDSVADWAADHRTALVLGLAGCGTVIGFIVGDCAGGTDPSTELTDFFRSCAQLLAALLIALALFQSGTSPRAGHSARRFLSEAVFPLLGAGLIASVAGLIPTLPDNLYRWAFAAVVGAGSGALFTTLVVGAGNIRAQRRRAVEEEAERLDPD